jgi:hypothetical protein
MRLFWRKKTVIPVACWYGETSEWIAHLLNEQAGGHPQLNGFHFEPAAIKDSAGNRIERPHIKTPEEFMELAAKSPIVIAAHSGVQRSIANRLEKIPEGHRPILIQSFEGTPKSLEEAAEKVLVRVLEHLKKKA